MNIGRRRVMTKRASKQAGRHLIPGRPKSLRPNSEHETPDLSTNKKRTRSSPASRQFSLRLKVFARKGSKIVKV